MKYLYLGAGILALGLALCIVSTAALGRQTDRAAALLDQALEAADRGDFDAAEVRTRRAMDLWERHKGFFGMILRHDEADQVTSTFRALAEYAKNHCAEEFSPTCAQLLAQIRHLSEMEAPHYYNIL